MCFRVCVYCAHFGSKRAFITHSTLLFFFVRTRYFRCVRLHALFYFEMITLLWLLNAPTNFNTHNGNGHIQTFLQRCRCHRPSRPFHSFPKESANIRKKYFKMSRYHSKYRFFIVFYWKFRSVNFWKKYYLISFERKFSNLVLPSAVFTSLSCHCHWIDRQLHSHIHANHQNHYQCNWFHGSVV